MAQTENMRTSSGGTVTSSGTGMYGKNLPDNGERRPADQPTATGKGAKK